MFDSLRNAFDYPLRQRVRWRRPGLQFRNQPKDQLYAHLPKYARLQAEAAAERLRQTYHLWDLYQHSRADNYRENLYYLELIESALNRAAVKLPDALQVADIGVSHWFYVQALHAALQWWDTTTPRTVTLTGYEADPYRVYADFHSRYDHALAHIRTTPGVTYVPEAFTPPSVQVDVAFMLFPFVFVRDHLRWGLPHPQFNPATLLESVCQSVRPGGWLVIVNQGEAEHEAQKLLLASRALSPQAAFRHESVLYTYDLPRYVLTVRA